MDLQKCMGGFQQCELDGVPHTGNLEWCICPASLLCAVPRAADGVFILNVNSLRHVLLQCSFVHDILCRDTHFDKDFLGMTVEILKSTLMATSGINR